MRNPKWHRNEIILALKYFKIEDDNYMEVLEEIFIKSVHKFNTLEEYFKLK